MISKPDASASDSERIDIFDQAMQEQLSAWGFEAPLYYLKFLAGYSANRWSAYDKSLSDTVLWAWQREIDAYYHSQDALPFYTWLRRTRRIRRDTEVTILIGTSFAAPDGFSSYQRQRVLGRAKNPEHDLQRGWQVLLYGDAALVIAKRWFNMPESLPPRPDPPVSPY